MQNFQLHHATNNTWGTGFSYGNRFNKTGGSVFLLTVILLPATTWIKIFMGKTVDAVPGLERATKDHT